MELKGKKINFLGDSITEGVGISAPDKHFFDIIKKECGLAAARNYGVSGTRIARQKSLTGDAWDNDFCKRALNMDDDADVIVVFGGTNDFGHGDAPIGQMSDRGVYTFYGALHTLITELMEKYPRAEIVFMTPLHRCNEDNPKGDGNKSFEAGTLSQYVNVIKEVTKYYSVPTLDLFSLSGIQPKVECNRLLYCPDGLHPNDNGHARIASRLAAFLKNL